LSRGWHDHDETQLPGPPRARQVLGALVMLIGGALLLGWIPFSLTTFAVVCVLVGAGLVV
jgi:hypothetical protein